MKPLLWVNLIFGLLISIAQADTNVDLKILQTRLTGNGCDRSSAVAVISPDFKDLSVLFDNYRVELNERIRARKPSIHKSCYIGIDVSVPKGWQFAFSSVDYRGFMVLPAGVIGFHRFSILSDQYSSSFYNVIRSFRAAEVKGPVNEDFYVHVEQPASELAWSTCGATRQQVNLLSQLIIADVSGRARLNIPAEMVLDSADASLRQNFSVVWRRCPR